MTSPDDGTARYFLQTSTFAESDPLTGSAAAIPTPHEDEVEQWEDRAVCVSCADGTIVQVIKGYDSGRRFDVALRHPGDAKWTFVQRNIMNVPGTGWRRCCLAYHRGKIILLNDVGQWCVVSTEKSTTAGQWWRLPNEREPQMVVLDGYLVETRQELLLVSVKAHIDLYSKWHKGNGTSSVGDDLASGLSVSVFALHDANGGVPAGAWLTVSYSWVQ